MQIIRKLREKYNIANTMLWRMHLTNPSMEIVYRDIFLRDLKELGIDDIFYPTGGSANNGLLYLITRCFIEFEIHNAIELGAGQTSILLSQLNARHGDRARIRTVEHDTQWAAHMRPKIHHDLVLSNLVEKKIDNDRISHYDTGYFDKSIKYDFVLVDGPPAYDRQNSMNRMGVVEMVSGNLSDSFILIIDDAERRGEEILVSTIRRKLDKSGATYRELAILANKRQHVFCSGSFSTAAYF